jgi:hypothetical protein
MAFLNFKGTSNNPGYASLMFKSCHIKARIARNSWLLRRFETQRWHDLDSRCLFMNYSGCPPVAMSSLLRFTTVCHVYMIDLNEG